MISRKTLLAAASLVAAVSGSALATTRSSFLDVSNISGLTINTSNAGYTYTVTVSSSPFFTYNSVNYPITDMIGFYVLSNDIDFSPLPALPNFGPPGSFSDDSSNSGTGAAAGWRSNPNNGLVPGQSLSFTFPSNFPIADIDTIGFHVRLSVDFPGTPGALTGNITQVPAPTAAALLPLGALFAGRRRRR